MSEVVLNELVIKGVHDRLSNNLSAIIADINSEVTDGITIDEAEQVLDYIPSIRELIKFPTLGIQDLPWKCEDDTGWELTGVAGLTVVAFIADITPRELAWKLRRYAQAIVRCVADGRRLDTADQAWGIKIKSVEPGKMLGRRENPEQRMTWIACTFEFRNDQTW